jgi:hypothetical protein
MPDPIISAITDLRVDMADRLARIETHQEGLSSRLIEHTQQDAINFAKLEDRVDGLVIHKKVAELAGGQAGRKRGLTWGASAAGIITILAEVLRVVVSG